MSEHGRIYALPLHLANQIAAGEVIERPASVLKELIENSLDAGASSITVEIEGAGRKLIRVTDNGTGIHHDDLALALSRHATSKLQSSEQLNQIASLGFRGEALPSIASISELTLSSKQTDSEHGWQLAINQERATPVHHPVGTTIEVRDLFFNVPARRHFLRSDKTELNHISTTLYRLALSQFGTAFHCQLSSSTKLNLPAAISPEQQQQRIAKICGKAFVDNSLYLEQDYEEIKLKGWVGLPEGHRPQTDIYYFFINGRVIRDRMINHAVRQAYSELIPGDRYPAFVLYLTIPLEQVDINVHPTKHEVRFRDARLIHGLITQAIYEAVNSKQLAVSVTEQVPSVPSHNTANKSESYHVSENHSAYSALKKLQQPTAIAAGQFGKGLCLLANRYLLAQTDDGQQTLIDIQQAEYAQRQQQFRNATASQSLRSRPILVPLSFSLEPALITNLSQQHNLLAEFGFDIQLNNGKVTLKSIPSLFSNAHLPDLIQLLAENINATKTAPELNELLIEHLPNVPIQSMQQASEILQTLSKETLPKSCYTSLNDENLSQLFIR